LEILGKNWQNISNHKLGREKLEKIGFKNSTNQNTPEIKEICNIVIDTQYEQIH
jgi:hypothetical protein